MEINRCPLCINLEISLFSKDKKRQYYQCRNCNLIYVDPQNYISKEEEYKRYNLHTNSCTDKNYIDFLSIAIDPILSNTLIGNKGVDYGCGSGPILKDLLKPYNRIITNYDPNYFNNTSIYKAKWDFIVTTEVIEHLKNPLEELKKMWNILVDNGILCIMTSRYTNNIDFKSWYYKGDPTHICFYTKESFIWIADQLGAVIEFYNKKITILKKK